MLWRVNLEFMCEKIFQSKFHKWYVGGEGEVAEEQPRESSTQPIRARTIEEILAEYRWYVNDSKAELPEEVLEHLKVAGKI